MMEAATEPEGPAPITSTSVCTCFTSIVLGLKYLAVVGLCFAANQQGMPAFTDMIDLLDTKSCIMNTFLEYFGIVHLAVSIANAVKYRLVICRLKAAQTLQSQKFQE